MKSIVFFNNKGGVGKTTLNCNVVAYLNMHKDKKVLLVDADPQCNATQAFLEDEVLHDLYLRPTSSKKTLLNYLLPLGKGEAAIDVNVAPMPGMFSEFKTDLIPGHPHMSMIEDRLSRAWGDLLGSDRIGGYRITNWVSQLLRPLQSSYDLIVFDVGPSLGALNRSVLLSCDYIVTPFGSDIFSLLGIKNISEWMTNWSDDYDQAIKYMKTKYPEALGEFPGVVTTESKFRFAGYSVQQYVARKFKTHRRPVKAYDDIMGMIPIAVAESMKSFQSPGLHDSQMNLGHIPFLYSLVPLAQSKRVPIHQLSETNWVKGAQTKQVAEYIGIIDQFCSKLLENIGERND
jgi:cellulose biosynthesis protein BcsQ